MMNKQQDKKIQSEEEEFTDQINEKNKKGKDQKDDEDIEYAFQKQIQEETKNKKAGVRKERSPNHIQYESMQEYLLFFENISIFRCSLLNIFKCQQQRQIIILQLQQQLKKNNFILMKTIEKENLNQLQRQSKILIKIKNKSKNYEVIQIMCSLGKQRYAKKYTILNQSGQSYRHKNKVIGIGSFGNVLLCQHNKNQSVVKCLKFTPQNINSLKNHIKQYFLCDMMSALQIGPKVLQSNGFSFILFNDCMQFQMEKCQHKVDEEIQTQLKEGLAKMHLLSIIHSDIKPANIMYSKQFKKNVFLDFGTSEIVKEVIGQKSLVNFRGTYEFCGKQMKKLFLSQKIQKVDLYANDVEMLKNSLCCPKNISGDSINLLKNEVKYLKSYAHSNHSKQLQFQFKYHLYSIQSPQKPRDLFQQFLAKFQQDTNYKENIQIMLSAIKFTSQIGELAFVYLKKHRIWKIPKYKAIQFLMNDTQFFQNKQNFDFEQKQGISFMKLYSLLTEKMKQQCNQKQDQNFVYLQNKFQNIEKLEKPGGRKIVLTFHAIYKYFIEACSFCKSKFKYSIQKKQMIAQWIMKIIDQDKQKSEFSLIVKDQHLPISQFANTKCKNLILVYQYLLNYRFEDNLTQSQFIKTLIILYDCIILGFQYFYFIQEYMIQFFRQLIMRRVQHLISIVFDISTYLISLTQQNFILTQQKLPLYQKKYFQLCLKDILIKLVQFIDQTVSQKQPYYSKRKYLQILWELFWSRQKQYSLSRIQKINQFLNQMQNQISLSTYQVYEHVISLFVHRKENLQKRKSPQYIVQCYPTPESSNASKYKMPTQFDQKVNCRQLSKMFHIGNRIQFYQQTFNFDYIFQIWDLILKYQGCPSINYQIFANSKLTFNSLDSQKRPIQLEQKIVQTLSNFNGSLLEIFSQNQNQYLIIHVLMELKHFYFRHHRSNFLMKQKPIIYQKLNKLKRKYPQQSFLYIIIDTVLLQSFPLTLIEQIQMLKPFFQSVLKVFQKYQKVNFDMKDKQIKSKQYIKLVYIFNRILFSNNYFYSHLEYWQNYRIKIVLRKVQSLSLDQFGKLYYIFFAINKSKYLIEILCLYCQEIDEIIDYSFYFVMNKAILYYIPSKILKNQLYIDFLQNLQIIKRYNPYPIYLIPIYIYILGFLKQLDADFTQWKQLLIQVINLTEKIPKNSQQVYLSIQVIADKFPEQLYLLSLQYFQKKFQWLQTQNSQLKIQHSRKYKILLRKLLKNKISSIFLYQKQIEQYIQKLQKINKMQEIYFFYQKDCKTRTIKKLFFKKLKKYKQNCLYNITFNNQQQNIQQYQFYQSIQHQQQKRVLLKILQTSQQELMRQKQIFYSHKIQFVKKYQIKNIIIFKKQGIVTFYLQTILKRQFLNISQEEYCGRIEFMEKQIEKIKKTAEYKLSEQTVDIIDEIFNIQRQTLLKELKQTKNMQLKDIRDKWIQSFI